MGLHFDPSISVGDILTACGLLAAAGGTIFGAVQLRQNRLSLQHAQASKRAELLLAIMSRLTEDAEIRAFVFRLDYRTWHFKRENFGSSDPALQREELVLDRLLYVISSIGWLLENRGFHLDDLRMFEFEVLRVMDNPGVQQYLRWLDREVARENASGNPFKCAESLAARFAPLRHRPEK